MTSTNKGGRLPVSKQFILDKRISIFRELIVKKWTNVDIGILFNIDSSAIPRILKAHRK